MSIPTSIAARGLTFAFDPGPDSSWPAGLLVGAGHIVAELDGPGLAVSDVAEEFDALAAAAWRDAVAVADE